MGFAGNNSSRDKNQPVILTFQLESNILYLGWLRNDRRNNHPDIPIHPALIFQTFLKQTQTLLGKLLRLLLQSFILFHQSTHAFQQILIALQDFHHLIQVPVSIINILFRLIRCYCLNTTDSSRDRTFRKDFKETYLSCCRNMSSSA